MNFTPDQIRRIAVLEREVRQLRESEAERRRQAGPQLLQDAYTQAKWRGLEQKEAK